MNNKKNIALLLVLAIPILFTMNVYVAAATTEEKGHDTTKHIVEEMRNSNSNLEIDAVVDTVDFIETIGIDIDDIEVTKTGDLALDVSVDKVDSTIIIEEADDEHVLMEITEGVRANKIELTDGDTIFVDGNEIVIEEIPPYGYDLTGNIDYTYSKKAPAGTKAGGYKYIKTYKRNISFGEKIIKGITLTAFILIMGAALADAGFISPAIANYGGTGLSTVLCALENAKSKACSIRTKVYYYKGKYKVMPGQWARRCDTEFFEKKNCKGKIGSTRKIYEVKWSGSIK